MHVMSSMTDSNHRPPHYEWGALTSWAKRAIRHNLSFSRVLERSTDLIIAVSWAFRLSPNENLCMPTHPKKFKTKHSKIPIGKRLQLRTKRCAGCCFIATQQECHTSLVHSKWILRFETYCTSKIPSQKIENTTQISRSRRQIFSRPSSSMISKLCQGTYLQFCPQSLVNVKKSHPSS